MTDPIPLALRTRDQWVLWRDEQGVKMPYAITGRKASSTNPTTWSSYERVRAIEAKGGYSGIGYVFIADDPFTGIDLDDCRQDGTNEPWAQAIIDEAASYAEVSPSGNGVKIWVIGSIPTSAKSAHIELYDRSRYFTVTGQRLKGAPSDVQPAQPLLDRLHAQIREKQYEPVADSPVAVAPPDDYLREWAQKTIAQEIARVMAAPDGQKHNIRFAAARLLGGLIPLGLATADEIESFLFQARLPKTEAARNERKAIRDGIISGAKSPLTPPEPPRQPLFDKDGYACCPTHETRLEPSKSGNGYHCVEYGCYWWKAEGYIRIPPGLVIGSKPAAPTPLPIEDWLHRGVTASDLQHREFAEVNWPVANILSEGCTLLAGKPKSKKSWLALGIAVDVALGRVTLGRLDTRRGRVIYLDLESNQRRMQSRVRAMLGSNPWPNNLHIFTEWPRGEAGIAQLEMFMEHYPDTILVICDILQNIRPARVKNANPYDEDYEAVKPLNQFGERHHAAVLALHHTRKAKADDVFDEISGSTGLSAGVAGMWVLGRMPNGPESILAIRGRDIVIDDDMALEWDDYYCRFTITGNAEERSMSQERRAVLDLMSDEGEYTPKDIATALGKPVNNIKQLLLHLFNDRYVDKTGYGKYVKVMGKQFYGLFVGNGGVSANGGDGDHADNSVIKVDRSGIKVPAKSYRSSEELSGGDNSLPAHPNAANTASNGKSYRGDQGSIETTSIDHDRKREQEALAAVGRRDYRAARRSATAIRGRKDNDRVNQIIDDAEQEFRRQKDQNGGYVSPEGY